MSDQNDDSQGYALMLLAGVLVLVVAGVLALATSKGTGAATKAASPATVAVAAALVGAPDGRVDFAPGSDALPVEASEVLVNVADAARTQADKVVLISGFHDASGDAAKNAELAKNRALAVRHALEANGVAPDRLVLDTPIVAGGGADARAARRVELRLR